MTYNKSKLSRRDLLKWFAGSPWFTIEDNELPAALSSLKASSDNDSNAFL